MKLNIRAKLIISFLVITVLTGVIGILGISLGADTYDRVEDLAKNRMPKVEGLDSIKINLGEIRRYEVQSILSASLNDSKEARDYVEKYNKGVEELGRTFSELFPEFKSDFAKGKIAEFNSIWKQYQEIHIKMINLVNQGNMPAAITIQRGESRSAYDQAIAAIDELIKYNTEQAQKNHQESEAAYKAERIKIIIILLSALVFSLGISIYISNSISKSVQLVASTAEKVGNGDLTVDEIQIQTKDELRTLAESFNKMLFNLRKVIGKVTESANQVAATAEEMSATSEQNASAAQQIARAIEELAKGHTEQTRIVSQSVDVVEQLTKSIDSIAAGAQEQARNMSVTSEQVANMAKRVQEIAVRTEGIKGATRQNYQAAQNGGMAVNKTVEGMKRIQYAVSDSADKISELGKQSQQIGEIIVVIDDIAEQTNLLALNAAIEAARAGEHGKGFAVVADEVRKLAERSGKATKEIAALITSIQRGTEAAVKSMEVGTQEVDTGVSIAQEAGNALAEILSVVEKAGSEVEEIAQGMNEIAESTDEVSKAAENVAAITEENTAATEEMAAGSNQVNSSIANIAAIAEQSAASAEEVSASTEEMNASTEEIAASAQGLSKMALELQKLVAQFRI